MRVIFSRKGFDSEYGGFPSPILPDGSILSFPIPFPVGCLLRDLHHREICVGDIASALSDGKVAGGLTVHLDPDSVECVLKRQPGWKPCFGQDGAAQSHLANQGVGPGDLFLFFGWFRRTNLDRMRRLQYDSQEPGVHSLFGWLQIGEVIQVDGQAADIGNRRPWLADHPHVRHASHMKRRNTIYVAADHLTLPGLQRELRGAGVFARWTSDLQLTQLGERRPTVWDVPAWMRPGRPGSLVKPLTYHNADRRWSDSTAPGRAILRSANKGQEFVMHVDGHAQAASWVAQLLDAHA